MKNVRVRKAGWCHSSARRATAPPRPVRRRIPRRSFLGACVSRAERRGRTREGALAEAHEAPFFFEGRGASAGAMAAPGAAHMQAKLVRGAGGARVRVAGAGRRAPAGTKGAPRPSKKKRRFCFALPRAPPRARAGASQATSGTHSPRMTVSVRLVAKSGHGALQERRWGRWALSRVRTFPFPLRVSFPPLRLGCALSPRAARARGARDDHL